MDKNFTCIPTDEELDRIAETIYIKPQKHDISDKTECYSESSFGAIFAAYNDYRDSQQWN